MFHALAVPLAVAAGVVSPSTVPQAPVTEIATYAGATVWVDGDRVLLRQGGATTALDVAPMRDLDLGPGPDGRPSAVYVRCAPSCNAYKMDLETRKETAIPVAAKAGISERTPTIWRDRLAFQRGGRLLLANLARPTAKPATVADFGGLLDDVELGPHGVAVAGEFSTEDDRFETEVQAFDLDHPARASALLDSHFTGEAASAGYGGLTATATGDGFWFTRLARDGCRTPVRQLFRSTLRAARKVTTTPAAPLAARAAGAPIPATPVSERCRD
jgi:hypothetical protein